MQKSVLLVCIIGFISINAHSFLTDQKNKELSQKNATNTTSFKTKIINAGKFIKRKINEQKEAIKNKLSTKKYRKQLEKEVYGSKVMPSDKDIVSFKNPLHVPVKVSYDHKHEYLPVGIRNFYINPLFDDSVTSEYVQMTAPKSSIKKHENGIQEIIYEDV